MPATRQAISTVELDRIREAAARIFDEGYEDLAPVRRLMLNVNMQAALLVVLRELEIEVEPVGDHYDYD